MRGRTIDGKMKESSVDKQTTDVWDMEGLRRPPVPADGSPFYSGWDHREMA